MKISKRQLKRIIKEEYRKIILETNFSDREANPHDGGMYGDDIEDRSWREAEYDRGYQDGYDALPPAGDASTDYDAGYEDGNIDGNAAAEQDYDMGYRY
jgi:hypothetical protein